MTKILKILAWPLLFPLSLGFNLATRFRNRVFDAGIKKTIRFQLPVISVGNLFVGGTGKTPHVEYLIRLLKNKYSMATLSRGYGRKTKGFILASESDTADTIGDEPMQYYSKFKNEIKVAVGEERALAIPSILLESEETNLVVMDDGYQHRRVDPQLQIVLTTFDRPFYTDYVMPLGLLRESRHGAKRADAFVVTKCPTTIDDNTKNEITQQIRRYAKPNVPVFFSTYRYATPIDGNGNIIKEKAHVVLLTGIANPQPFYEQMQKDYTICDHIIFPDHHRFSQKDCLAIKSRLKIHPDAVIVTTEKDYTRMIYSSLSDEFKNIPLYFLPIEVIFLNCKEEFDSFVTAKII